MKTQPLSVITSEEPDTKEQWQLQLPAQHILLSPTINKPNTIPNHHPFHPRKKEYY